MDARLKSAAGAMAVAIVIIVLTNLVEFSAVASIVLFAACITALIVWFMAMCSWLWDQRDKND